MINDLTWFNFCISKFTKCIIENIHMIVIKNKKNPLGRVNYEYVVLDKIKNRFPAEFKIYFGET